MFDADDRYKQRMDRIKDIITKSSSKTIRVNLSIDPYYQKKIEDFRVKFDINGNTQRVIMGIIEFWSVFDEFTAMGKKDPNFITELKNETNLQKHIDFIYDNCDRNESEVIRDAAQANIDRWDDYELRRKNQQLRRRK